MGKKLRKLYGVVRKPLIWALTVMMITQLFPAQAIAEAVEELNEPTPLEEVVAPEETTPIIVEPSADAEDAQVAEPVAEAVDEPAPAAKPADEPAPQEEPADTPAVDPETAPASEPEAPAAAYPHQSLKAAVEGTDDTVVTVFAFEGSLPAGSQVVATKVDSSDVADAVEAAAAKAGKDVGDMVAIDVTILDADGNEIEPLGPVYVNFDKVEVETDNVSVYHIDDETGTADVLDTVYEVAGEQWYETDGFSVYVVVETGETGDNARLTVNFVNGSTTIASMDVKQADVVNNQLETVLYDPGVGFVPATQVFRGWTTKQNYTVDDIETGVDINGVRNAVKAQLGAGVAEGTEVTYYALIYNVYDVTYKASNSVVLGTAPVYSVPSQTTIDYTINMQYTPASSDQEFQGWYITPAENATLADGSPVSSTTAYPNLTKIKLTGSVTLMVSAPDGHWLIFKENGKNVSYTSPQFLENGETTTRPSNPTRLGYTFGGWYTNAECTGNQFTFGRELAETTTLYAKWTAIENANYTVIIWKQNIDGDGYDFEEAIVLSGRTNQAATGVTANGQGNNRIARVNNQDKRYTGFHLDSYDQNVTVTPEGNAVVNVYYNRNEYTLHFQIEDYTYTVVTNDNDNRPEKYGDVNGQKARIYWRRGAFRIADRDNAQVYTGTVYTRSDRQSWQDVKVITALYQQSIGDNFPITGYTDSRWSPQNSSTFSNVLVYIDIMPAENVTFHQDTSNAAARYMEFYVEALPGQTPDRTWNGKNFVKYGNTITAKYNYFTEAEDFLELTGYEKYGSDPAFSNGRADVDAGGTLRLYYTRSMYVVNFMDGGYFDGNGNPIEDEDNRGTLGTSDEFAYGADISSLNDFEPSAYTGYVFSGWYIDKSCTQEYTFTTMPEGGVTVYAKWVQVQYRVFLNPNVPRTDTTFSMGGQDTSFRVNAGEGINPINGVRDDYELVGWYTDEGFTHAFNFDAYTLNDGNTKPYDKTRPTETDLYGDATEQTNKDVGRPWITRSLDLYAKWRSKLLGADGINVVYDAGEGTNEPTDDLLYKDLSSAVAGAASTSSSAERVFSQWRLQKWENGKWVDTDEVVLPGDTFTVRKAYAQVVENPDNTPANPSYTYTVRLRAEYVNKDHATTTHITWYANNGTGASTNANTLADGTTVTGDNVPYNANVVIAPADTFSWAGHTFIGWAKKHTTDSEVPTEVNFLWYNPETGKFYSDSAMAKEATYVAADEGQPYDDLYAIWAIDVEVEITGSKDTVTYNGSEQSNSVYTVKYKVNGEYVDALPEGVTCAVTATQDDVAVSPIAAKGTNAGTYTAEVTATLSTTTAAYYLKTPSATADVVLVIEPAPLAITVNGSSDSRVYNGSEQTYEGTVTATSSADAFDASKFSYSGDTTASGINAGEYKTDLVEADCSYDDDNYIVTWTIGAPVTLTINPASVTLTAASDTYTYDGTEQTLTGFTSSVEGLTFSGVSASGSGTTVGNYPVTFTGVTVNETKDTTGNYVVTGTTDGTLTIDPAAITIKADDKTKVYDNDTTTDPELTATVTGKPTNGVEPTYTLSRVSGQDVAEYAITVTVDADANPNYTISVEGGTFSITPAAITIKADNKTKVYDNDPTTDPKLTATVTGKPANGVDPVYSLSRVAGQNVNTYAITVTAEAASNPNYTISVEGGTFSITKAPLTIDAKNQGYTYNGQNQGPVGTYTEGFDAFVTVTGLKGSDALTSITLTGSKKDAGFYRDEIVASAAQIGDSTDNYEITYTPGDLTISKAKVVVVAQDASKTYGEADPEELQVEIRGDVYGTDTIAYTISRAQGEDVGNYNIHVTGDAEQGSYDVEFVDATFTINPKAITIKADDKTKTYDNDESTDPELTATVTGVPTNGVAPVYSLSRAEGQDVGDYAITVTAAADANKNYTISVESGTFSITKVAITIKADDKTKVYDNDSETDPELTATVTGLPANGVAPSYTLSRVDGQDVGDYAITVTAAADANPNYTITVEGGTFSITPAAITIKADDKTKVYDNDPETDPELTATVGGVPENGVAPSYSLSRVEGQDVNDYAITVTATADANKNYTVSVEGGTFSITPAAITIKADNKTKVYDNDATTDPELTATVTGVPDNGVAPSYSLSREEGQNVGDYAITVTAAAASNPNYTITVEAGTFSITKAAITIKADDKSKIYDNDSATDPELTATVTGKPANGVAPVYSLAREDGQDVDEYAITVTAAAASNPNYDITVEGGTFSITPAAITIKADDKTKVYDNDSATDPELTATVTGKPANGVAPSYSLSRVEGQDVNNYAITVTAEADANPNYTITVEGGTFSITKAAITIKADDKSKVYDNDSATDPELTATVTGKPANGVAPSYSLSRVEGQDVDDYAITVTAVADANPNYTITVEGGTFSITPAAITIKADNKTKVYDNNPATDPELTATVSGVPTNGVAPSYSLAREEGQAVGEYAITVTAEAASNPNYTVSVEGGTFTITTLKINVVADDKTKVYDNDESTDPELTAQVTGAVDGDKINYTLSRVEGQNVGEYTIVVTLGDNPNYEVGKVDGTFTITPKAITIKADNKTKVYDNDPSTDPELTATLSGVPTNGVAPVYSLAREAGQDVDEYTITVTAEAESNKNYTITTEDGTFSITPAAITISANDKTKVYDNDVTTDPALDAEVTGVPTNGVDPVYSLSREAGQDVGEYAITVTAEADANKNYTITTEGGTFSITPAKIKIVADDKTKVYDNDASTDPELTATVEGVPTNGVAPIYSLSRESGQDVANYTISVAAPADSNKNYTIETKTGTFSITPAEITIKADDKTKVYDNDAATDPKLTATVTGVPTNGVEPVYTLSRESGQDVDEYTISVSAAAASNPNYTVTVEEGTFSITPAKIKIVADDKTKVYDNDSATDPKLTATVTGVPANGVAPDFSLSREAGQDVDEYTISVTAEALDNPNYTISVETGTFSITPAAITIKADDKTKVYDNDASTDPELDAEVTGVPTNGVVPVYSLAREAGQDVDEYTITVTAAADSNPNYTITTEGGTFTITPAAITIKADDKTKVYDNDPTTDPALTATVTGVPTNGVDPVFSLTREAGQDVDEYTISVTAEAASNPNYTIKTETGTFTITPAQITVKADDKTKVYDNDETTDPKLTATITGAVEGDEINYTLSREPGQNVDEYDIIVTLGENPNYTVAKEDGTFTITPAAITIKADDKTKIYDNDESTDPELTATLTGVPTNGVAPAYSLTREAGQDVNDYAITVTAPAASNPNYTITVEEGTFTITPKAITIKADDKSKVYDNDATTDPELTATVTGVPTNGVAPTYSLSREEGQNVGEYDITVTAAAASNPNYTISVEGGTFSITPAAITIKADNKTKVYDNDESTDPELTATVEGVPTNGVAPDYSLAREEGQDVDEYAISVTAAAASNPNYTITTEAGTFSITPKAITIKADDQTKVYDNDPSTDPALTATVTGIPTKGVAPVYSLAREAGQDVDEYTISVTAETLDNPNYTITTAEGTFSITPKAITIKADDQTKVYDNDASTDPELTATVTGVPTNGVAPVYSLAREEGQDVGEYTITVTAEEASNPNYTITVESGTFEITPAKIKIAADDQSKVYDNDATTDPELTATVTGVPAKGVALVYSLAREEGQDVGEYTISVTAEAASNKNYTIETEAGTFEITPKAITIAADNKSKIYDNDPETDPALTATVTGVPENGVAPVYSLAREEGQDVGQYTITVTAEAASNKNYSITTTDGTFLITTAEITVVADNKTKVYDNDAATDPVLTAKVTGAVEGDEIAYTLSREEGQNVGEYKIIVTLGENPNYDVSKVDGTFTITPAEITIKANDKTKVYDNDATTDPELDAEVTGVPAKGVEPVYSLSREEGQNVGEYTITVTAEADTNKNYTVKTETGTFEITPAEITIKANDKTKVYDNDATTDPELDAEVTGVPAKGVEPVYSLSREGGQDVGEYTISVTAAAASNPNYTVKTEDGTFEITPAKIKIAADDQTKVYDNDATTDPELTATVSGVPTKGVAPVYTVSREDGQDVGEYTISVAAPADSNKNYEIETEEGTFEITPAKITISANDKSKVYDNDEATDPELTATVTGIPTKGVEPVYSLSREEGQDVGEYTISVAAPADSNKNYEIETEDGTFEITPAKIKIAADDKNKVYDNDEATDPELTATVSGVPTKGVTPVYSLDREDGQDVGEYTITVTAEEASNKNYEIETEEGTFEITPAKIKIAADDKNKVYDNDATTDPELTATVTGVPTNGVAPVYSLAREEGQDVGEYTITVTAEAASNKNYEIETEDGTFEITPAAITIQAENKSKVYDNDPETDPALTAKVTGVPENGVAPVYSLAREEGQDVGQYKITVTAEAASNKNYSITTTDGTFVISTAKIVVIADNQTKVYDNDATTDPELTAQVTGAVEGDEIVYTLSREEGQNVGEYDIVVTLGENPNYEVDKVDGTFEITPAEITIKANDKAKVYDNDPTTDPELDATVTGVPAKGVEPVYSLDRVDGQDVGEYTITVTAAAASNPNYTVKTEDGTFEITPAKIKIAADDQTKVYDNDATTDPELTATVSGVPANGVAPVYTVSREDGQDVDEYTISVSAPTDSNKNYEIETEDGTFTITPAKIKIAADDQTKVYDNDAATDPELTATVTGVPTKGVEPVYSLSREDGQDVGEYTISVTAEAASNKNYTIETEEGTFEITPAKIKIAADDQTKVYDNDATTDPELTATVTGVPAKGVEPVYTLSREDGQDIGEYTITVTAAAANNKNYEIETEDGTFTIIPAKITISANDKTKVYDNDATTDPELDATVTGVPAKGVEPVYSLAREDGQDVGEYTITVTAAAESNPNYTITTEDGTFEITPAKIKIAADDQTKVYDNDATTDPELTATVTGVPTNGVEPVYTLSREEGQDVGEYTITVTAEAASNKNYEIETEDGTFEITPAKITISANDKSKTYDNDASTDPELDATVTGVPAKGVDPVYTLSREEGQDVDGYTITVAAPADSNKNYTITTEDGTFEITAREVTVKVQDRTVEYNGVGQYGNETYTFNNVVTDQTATITYTPAAGTLVGEYDNGKYADDFKVVDADGNDVTANYTLGEQTAGKLTITDREDPYTITVVANSNTGNVYDGNEYAAEGFETLEFTVDGNTYTVSGLKTSDPASTDVCELTNEITGTAVVKDAKGNDVTDQFTVTTENGTLEITAREVTVSVADKTVEYNGSEQYGNTAYTFENVASGQTATITYTPAAGTLVGEYDNGKYADDFKVVDADGNDVTANYTLGTQTAGKLTITDRTDKYEITVVANSNTGNVYDGNEYAAEGFETLEFTVDGNTYTVSGLKTSDPASTDVCELTNEITGTAVVKDAKGNDVTDQFTVTTEDGTLSITPAKIKIAADDQTKVYDNDAETDPELTATVTGVPAKGAEPVYTVTREEGQNVGEYTITVNAAADANPNYTITTEDGTFTITQAKLTITANDQTYTYNGKPQGEGDTAYEDPAEIAEKITVTGLKGDDAITSIILDGQATDAGVYTDEIVPSNATIGEATGNYDITYVNGTLTIDPRKVTLTSASDTKEYDGFALTNDTVNVTGDGWADGEGASYDVTGSQTIVGDSENSFTYTLNEGTKASNYEIETEFGTLTVTDRTDKYKIQVVSSSDEATYDGTEHTVSGFVDLEFDVAKEDDTFHVTVSGLTAKGAGTDAGSYANAITGTAVVTDANGNDVTDQFEVLQKEGTLEIAKRSVTLTSATDSKEYDGNPLTNDKVTVSGDGFVNGEGATYDVTGSQTIVGASENSFTYTLNEGTKADNYEIETVPGTLTVTNREAKYEITVVGSSAEATYDGEEHSATGFETLTFEVEGNTYTVSGLTAENPTETNAGTYTNNVTGTPVVTDANGNDVSDQFAVSTENGELVINKRSVTLTSVDDEKVYDGTALVNSDVKVSGDGFVGTEGFVANVTGSQTEVGSSENEFTYTLKDNTLAGNYEIETVFGTLEVTPVTAKVTVTITEHSDSVMYSGSEQKVTGYNVSIDNELYTEADFTFSGDDTAAGTNVGVYDMELKPEDFANISKNFSNVEFVIVDGQLEITTREVILTSATDSKTYDGSPLTNESVTVSGDGWADGEGATYSEFASITNVGEVKNDFTYTLNDGTGLGNYVIKQVFGTLTVTEKSIEDPDEPGTPAPTLEIEGPEDTVYNAEEQKQPVTITDTESGKELVEGTDFELAYSDNTTDAGEVTVTVTGKGNYEGEFELTYEITPRPVTLTTYDAEKVYDGTALTCGDYEITDEVTGESLGQTLLAGQTIGVEILGSQTYVGSSANGDVDITWAQGETSHFAKAFLLALAAGNYTAKKSNYDLSVEMGTLTVTDEGVDPDKVITKTHEGNEYGLGDTVTFTLSATNIYDEARSVTFVELEGVEIEQATFENVEPGETVTTTATYTITEADILAGEFKNEASAVIGEATPVPTDDTVTTEEKTPHLTVTKVVTSDVPAEGVSVGDVIEYEITVENDGNVTISDVKVTDELTGDEWTIDALAPGEVATFTTEYTVTEADAKAGSVKNVAVATGVNPEDEPIEAPGETETPVKPVEEPAPEQPKKDEPKKDNPLPSTGDASMLPAVVAAAAGTAALVGSARLRRRREDEQL